MSSGKLTKKRSTTTGESMDRETISKIANYIDQITTVDAKHQASRTLTMTLGDVCSTVSVARTFVARYLTNLEETTGDKSIASMVVTLLENENNKHDMN